MMKHQYRNSSHLVINYYIKHAQIKGAVVWEVYKGGLDVVKTDSSDGTTLNSRISYL